MREAWCDRRREGVLHVSSLLLLLADHDPPRCAACTIARSLAAARSLLLRARGTRHGSSRMGHLEPGSAAHAPASSILFSPPGGHPRRGPGKEGCAGPGRRGGLGSCARRLRMRTRRSPCARALGSGVGRGAQQRRRRGGEGEKGSGDTRQAIDFAVRPDARIGMRLGQGEPGGVGEEASEAEPGAGCGLPSRSARSNPCSTSIAGHRHSAARSS